MIEAIIIVVIILSAYLLFTFYKIVFLNNAPFINSSNKKINLTINETLGLENIQVVYELGCGEAKFLRKLKRKKPELICIGLEYNLIPYLLAHIKNFFLKKKIIIKRADIFNYNLSQADLIYCYLNPSSMEKLMPVFQNLNNTIIISNTFSLPNTKPYKQISFKNTSLFFYVIT
jgi:16S rRNA A1518/A1519 N6-dimethyltransferase RsmA/KsgA/DIM1 with predicted DNA glycosylase/AP lyase activity